MIENEQGGLIYCKTQDLKKAIRSKIMTLPDQIEGANCSNCHFSNQEYLDYFCDHPKIKLNVTERMVCSLWDHKECLRAWDSES